MNHQISAINRPQSDQCCSLGVSQPGNAADVHAFVRHGRAQCVQAFSGHHIPEPDAFILAAAGKYFPIRAEGHGPDPVGVLRQNMKTFAAAHIPYADIQTAQTQGTDLGRLKTPFSAIIFCPVSGPCKTDCNAVSGTRKKRIPPFHISRKGAEAQRKAGKPPV